MAHTISRFTVLRVFVFVALMVFSWALWLTQLPGARGQGAVWLLLSSIALLFGWSFVLYPKERTLAWLCWLSVLAMILLGLWLPRR
jgi:hypothetical protein